jgi:hypothetical protein
VTSHRFKAGPRAGLAALLAFAILFWWLALATPDEAEDAVAAPGADRELEPAPQPLAATTNFASSVVQPVAKPESPEPEPAVQAALDPAVAREAEVRALIPPDTRGFIDAIQGRYEGDARDRDAGSVETALQVFFRSTKLPASALRSVVCKQSVCKLEMYWRPEYDAPYRSALDDLANGNAKFVATRAEAPDKNGGVSLDAYWLRALGSVPEPTKP